MHDLDRPGQGGKAGVESEKGGDSASVKLAGTTDTGWLGDSN